MSSAGIELLLVRHGNTFAPGDRVVWVGRGEDLPLVESGRDQARALGRSLEAAGWAPTAAVAGELQRQREHLQIATGGRLPLGHRGDLDEVDYGAWGGLTTDEIVERFGADGVEGWNTRSAVPEGAGWPESAGDLRGRARRFADEVEAGGLGDRVLACSSNGLIRWFLDLVPGAFDAALDAGTFKVKTGHTCRLVVRPGRQGHGGTWSVLHWNQPPDAALDGAPTDFPATS